MGMRGRRGPLGGGGWELEVVVCFVGMKLDG